MPSEGLSEDRWWIYKSGDDCWVDGPATGDKGVKVEPVPSELSAANEQAIRKLFECQERFRQSEIENERLREAVDEFLTAACDPPPEGLAAAIERLNDHYAALHPTEETEGKARP